MTIQRRLTGVFRVEIMIGTAERERRQQLAQDAHAERRCEYDRQEAGRIDADDARVRAAAMPDAFRPCIADVSERMHCPPDFVAVPMLVAAASFVARRVGIRPQQRTDWLERGSLWALIVGRPGIMKSPAMSQALAPMDRLDVRATVDFNAQATKLQADLVASKLRAEAGVKAARAALKKDGRADISSLIEGDERGDEDEPRKRYVVNDLTYEKLGEILSGNPEGVLSVRDEMRGLLLNLSREESPPARAFYLQAWSGGRYTFDRIGQGAVSIEDARLCIVGGIQPRAAVRPGHAGSQGCIRRRDAETLPDLLARRTRQVAGSRPEARCRGKAHRVGGSRLQPRPRRAVCPARHMA